MCNAFLPMAIYLSLYQPPEPYVSYNKFLTFIIKSLALENTRKTLGKRKKVIKMYLAAMPEAEPRYELSRSPINYSFSICVAQTHL